MLMDTSQPRVKLSASASPTLTLRVRRVCTRQLKISLCGMRTSITRALAGSSFREQMLQRGKLNDGEPLDFAFGLVLEKYRGLDTVDHGGADAGYRADMTRFPEQHFSAAGAV